MDVKRTKAIIFFCIIIVTQIFSQEESFPSQNDPVFLQSTPIFIGEEVFTQKIQAISKEREPLALVLSGGSARAYAHVGVLRQLEKANIKPDFIVANSMGAIIGLLYASGFSADDIEYVLTTVDLNSFFDIVFPLNGGLLSTRYFTEALSRLFPDRTFDIADSFIPIIIPTEDLYSKRQILFAQGDITTIMTAAFAMSFMMNPIPYTLSDGTETLLIDSGAIDLGSVSIARLFTNNIILSTALYTPTLNYNNPVVVLNRSFSIGKERLLVSDYLEFQPMLIRNDVESFSFMDFSKVTEIIKKGDTSTLSFLSCANDFDHDSFSLTSDFVKLRDERSASALDFCQSLQKGIAPFSMEPVFGMKIRANISTIDNPDFFLSEPFSLGAYAFFDYKPFFIRGGLHTKVAFDNFDPLFYYGSDIFLRYRTSYGLTAMIKASYTIPYTDFFKGKFFAGALFAWHFPVFENTYLRPYVEAEMDGNERCYPTQLLTRGGLQFSNVKGRFFSYLFDPYVFASTENFTELYRGLGIQFFTDITPVSFLGFKIGESLRYSPLQNGTYIFNGDNYRGNVPVSFTSISPKKLLSLSQAELYWYSKNTGITAMEAFKLEQLKIGLFGDFLLGVTSLASSTSLETQSFDYYGIAGLFTRANVSLSGLASFNLEAALGWNFGESKFHVSFSFAQYW